MKNIVLIILISVVLFSCENSEWEFDDFGTKACYFPHQTPARSLILGKYTEGLNENDNKGVFQIGVTMTGVYENEKERKVYFEKDESLLANAANVQALPDAYYTIEASSPVTIEPGSIKGIIPIQLNEAFFQDTLSYAAFEEVNYVIPLRITQVEGLDTILSGVPVVANPDRLNPEHWAVQPKDYTLYGIKFINKYHGNYLRRGVDVKTNASGESINNVYHAQYVEWDEVVPVNTSGYTKVQLSKMAVRGGEGEQSPGDIKMVLNFDNDGSCTVASAPDDAFNISGTGQFVEEGDTWGGKPRDVIHLSYTYSDAVNNETHTVKDTLVIRDRNVTFEEFQVELN